MSSGIRILDSNISFPDVEIAQDVSTTIDIESVDPMSIDIGLLGNQKKLNSPSRFSSSGGGGIVSVGSDKLDEIEVVNLDDIGGVSYDVKPIQTSSSNESIKITRDTETMQAARPFTINAPTPAPAASAAPMQSSSLGGGVKSWFSAQPSESAPASASSESTGGIASSFKSWFGAGSSSGGGPAAPETVPVRLPEYLTPEQEFLKKTEGLTMLERMDKRGIVGNKMTVANTLEEIQAEVERRKDSKALETSLRFQRSMLTTVSNGLEFLNSRFDPLGIKLDGWSEQVSENIEDYDEIFEELYDKYKDKSKVAPEVRLVMSLGLSAAMCHVTNTMFKSRMPGMDDILRNNPELAQKFVQAAASQAVGPGFEKFVSMGFNNSRRNSFVPQRQHESVPSGPFGGGLGGLGGGLGAMFGSMFQGGAPTAGPPSPSRSVMSGGPPPATATARREMRGPTGVDDILKTLNQAGESVPNRSVIPPASPQFEVEEVASVRSGFTTATDRMAGRSRRRQTAQPVGATLTLNV
jgi:hypothetical protein